MGGLSGRNRLLCAVIACGALLGTPALPTAAAPPARGEDAVVTELRDGLGGTMRMRRQSGSGRVRFLGTTTGRPLSSVLGARGLAASTVARSFLQQHAALFGVSPGGSDLQLKSTTSGAHGGSAVRLQQVAGGVPVLGGEMVVSLDRDNNVLSASGETTPASAIGSTTPRITAAAAGDIAVGIVARDRGTAATGLRAAAAALSVYDPALLGAPGTARASLVWRVEVAAAGSDDIERVVFVDARSGYVRLNFDPRPHAKQRFVCDRKGKRTESDACSGRFDLVEGGSTARVSRDVLDAYLYAGDTYDYFKSRFGRDSIDNKGLPIKSTVRYCPEEDPDDPGTADCPYANAYWNGRQMVYGAGFASGDDVVAHELTHGVTQYEANLFSLYQAGAINESISDIFGELVDQYNATIRTRGRDSTGAGGTVDYRWLIFEDGPTGFGRSMRSPASHKDPDRIRSGFYSAEDEWSKRWDNGGVHANAGVGNKAAYLMAMGGEFNRRSIPAAAALGNEKLAQLFYRALTQHLTSGSDYADLADALQQSCAELVAQDPIPVAGQLVDFEALDCATVKTAVEATEMYLQPIARRRTNRNGSVDVLDGTNPEAPVCDIGEEPAYLFYDNLEHPSVGNWKTSKRIGRRDWTYPQNPNPFDVELDYAKSGKIHMFGDDPEFKADLSITTTRTVIPTASTYLRIDHAHVFDFNYETGLGVDSGVVEYSVDGTTFVRLVPQAGKPYGPITSAAAGNNSTIQGRGFVGDSHGYVSSRFFLGALAGQKVSIRFRIASDMKFGNFGWFIDDVRVYDCAQGNVAPSAPPPPPVITSVTPAEDGLAVVWSAQTAPTGISGFLITARSATDTTTVSVPSGTMGYTLRGLTSTAAYVVTVRARSAFGDALSAPSAAVTPADLSPPAPARAVTVSGGSGAAVVSWTPDPRSADYGSRVVTKPGLTPPRTSRDGAVVEVRKGNSVRIGGLRAGTAYSIAVFPRDGKGILGTTPATATAQGSTLTLSTNLSTVDQGGVARLGGTLLPTSGRARDSQVVVLYDRPIGTTAWRFLEVGLTTGAGAYTLEPRVAASSDVQARFRGGPGTLGSVSPVVRILVKAAP